MGLIERIKSALGLGSSASPSQPGTARDHTSDTTSSEPDQPSEPKPASEVDGDEQLETAQTVVQPSGTSTDESEGTDGVDVTVEHDPEDSADESGDAEAAVEPDTASEDAVKGTDTADVDADLEDIKGIGPAYADRLREAGVDGVAALADADAADLSDATGIGAGRIQKWIDRATAR